VQLMEQYLSPMYIVNDRWTGGRIHLSSGSLQETVVGGDGRGRPISCPSYWASIEQKLLVQLVWGRRKGQHFVPDIQRQAPPYWKNCRLNTLGVHVDNTPAEAGETLYHLCFFVGIGKGPRAMKCSGTPGEFFKGLVIMDGKNTLGLE
jgi:hypothetical protein